MIRKGDRYLWDIPMKRMAHAEVSYVSRDCTWILLLVRHGDGEISYKKMTLPLPDNFIKEGL